jgi:hypothetical protein
MWISITDTRKRKVNNILKAAPCPQITSKVKLTLGKSFIL